jgi:hypothetical protein
LRKIVDKIGGELKEYTGWATITFHPRKDLFITITIEEYEPDDDKMICSGSKLDYEFTTQNVSGNWIKSQWEQRKSHWALVHEMFISLQHGYNRVYERLVEIHENYQQDEFFDILDEYAKKVSNIYPHEDAEEILLTILDKVRPAEDEDENDD